MNPDDDTAFGEGTIYYFDAAYQNYVLTMHGLKIEKVSIIRINAGYVYGKNLDLNGLFQIEDVTGRVCEMYTDIADRIAFLVMLLNMIKRECSAEMPYITEIPLERKEWLHQM